VDIALWIIAGLLAAVLLLGGVVKLVRPREELAAAGMGFAEDLSAGGIRAVGALEVLAGVGLVLPAVLGVAPVLVPLAAVGVVLLMVGAIVVHLRRGEVPPVAVNLALLALAAFVAWGRFGPAPFAV
jgi:DoxX-like protein